MALALKKTDLQQPAAAGRLHEDRKPSAEAAFFERTLGDDGKGKPILFLPGAEKLADAHGLIGGATY